MAQEQRGRDPESWADVARTFGWAVFIALVIWVLHIKLDAERARARTPHPPMLMCEVGC